MGHLVPPTFTRAESIPLWFRESAFSLYGVSMATKMNTLEDLYIDQLKDLYSAEKQLIKALPKMAKAAHSLI
jgi:hypothetical protein